VVVKKMAGCFKADNMNLRDLQVPLSLLPCAAARFVSMVSVAIRGRGNAGGVVVSVF
jgi:hypothetical protein